MIDLRKPSHTTSRCMMSTGAIGGLLLPAIPASAQSIAALKFNGVLRAGVQIS